MLPRHVGTLWERGRYVEYMFAFSFFKTVQDFYERPLISSGCFSVYRTAVLKAHGGWNTRTMAEDMDLTWSFYQAGHGVRFVPEAICYPIEPHDFHFMSKQLRRWSHGFVQNVRLHWRGLLGDRFLRSTVSVALWDAAIASFAYLFLLPLAAIVFTPLVPARIPDRPAGRRGTGAGNRCPASRGHACAGQPAGIRRTALRQRGVHAARACGQNSCSRSR